MKLQFGQHQTQKQIQTLAPRMIQSMEILQMPLAELTERIEQELTDNPVLEMRDKDPNLPVEQPAELREARQQEDVEQKELIIEEGHNADDFERLVNLDQEVPTFFDDQTRPSSNRVQESMERHADLMANVPEHAETLQQHLLQQLTEWELSEPLKNMCERIISTLSPRDGGYLRVSLRDLLPADADPSQLDLAEEALAIVQSLDPPGIAARDLRECLLLQLHPEIPNYHLVHQLIQNHLEDLSENRMPQIQKSTGASLQEILEAWQSLRRLDPKPASRFNDEIVEPVTPDVYLVQDDEGNYIVKMDEGPSQNLRISKYYLQRLANPDITKEERDFIRRKITAAQWLLEAIEQRRNTLMKVAQAIVDHQRRFIDEGPDAIEPLKMQQIADKVGVHVTTVSRAVDDKWLDTPRGLFPLRKFFVGGTTTEDGEDVAWDRIRRELQKLIDSEDKSEPFSDDELVKRLRNAGLKVARRTITKYRQKMGIPSSRQRRDWTQVKQQSAHGSHPS